MKHPANRNKIHYERVGEIDKIMEYEGHKFRLNLDRSKYYTEMGLDRFAPHDLSMKVMVENNPLAMEIWEYMQREQVGASAFWEEQAVCTFCLGGKRVFRVGHELTEMLVATDFKIKPEHFHLPFDAFYLAWDHADLSVKNPDGTRYPLEGCYVYRTRETSVRDEKDFEQLAFLWVAKGRKDGDPLQLTSDDNLFHLRIRIEEQDLLTSDKFGMAECMPDGTLVDTDTGEVVDQMGSPLRQMLNLTMNSILYITSSDPDLMEMRKPSDSVILEGIGQSKLPKLQRKKEKLSNLPYTEVGGSIKLPRGGPEKRRGLDPTGRTLRCHFQVIGHWRDQPCGEGKKDIKRIWIKPHWKGPDTAETVHSEFEVK